MTKNIQYIPDGYKFSTACAGFRPKTQAGRDDVGLILSEKKATLAAVFTRNKFAAAPVVIGREILKSGKKIRAILINSGLANACTGEEGISACLKSQSLIAEKLNLFPYEIAPASTGLIGTGFDIKKWEKIARPLADRLGGAAPEDFARAIMTTDAFPKIAHENISLSGGETKILGIAKGAGMICPNMATMLCVVLCDIKISPKEWQGLLKKAVNLTFNRVSVDGDTSTNDTVYALANGASGLTITGEEEKAKLLAGIKNVLAKLAHMLVKDGEGASKIAHITVNGAKNDADAEKVARTVGNSLLVKTALYGCDPNWGRIVAAIGRSGAKFDPKDVRLSLCGIEIFCNEKPLNMDVDVVFADAFKKEDIEIDIFLGFGPGKYELLASDLGHEYVDCNASYRT